MPRWGEGFPSSPLRVAPKLSRPLLEKYHRSARRLSRFEANLCGSSAKLIFRLKDTGDIETLEGEVKAIPLGCGSVFCPVCSAERKRRFFRKRDLGGYGHLVTVTAHYRVNSALDTYNAIGEFYDLLRRFYRFRMGNPARVRRLFFNALRKSNLTPKQKAKQLQIFRKFWALYLPVVRALKKRGKELRLYDFIWGVGVVEVTAGRDEGGYYIHPHLHMYAYGGITGGVIPQVLLSAIWEEVTGGKFYITHIKSIPSEKAVEYFESYVEVKVEGDFPRQWLEFGLYGRRRFLEWKPLSVRQGEAWERRTFSLENTLREHLSRWFVVDGVYPRVLDDYLVEEIGLWIPSKGSVWVRGSPLEWFLDRLIGISR